MARNYILKQRQIVTKGYRTKAQAHIIANLKRLACVKKARRIATFLSVGSEVDLRAYQTCTEQQMYAPVISRYASGIMYFASVKNRTRANRFRITEPQTASGLPLFLLDVIFVPLVGFDRFGNRLGMGGGYYDRIMQRVQHVSQHTGKVIHTVGVAFAAQQMDVVPHEAHDVQLDYVVTESAIHCCLQSITL